MLIIKWFCDDMLDMEQIYLLLKSIELRLGILLYFCFCFFYVVVSEAEILSNMILLNSIKST